ncbi:MAG: AraC family transcriptional regulator [Lachnospiraceae bacterium]|nr:AraC family transcriptional regulator [Lachnospiraceae bacterium]MDD3616834.1 AraC family transcriptional regulator [Lachnospiraceae bacterium]
MNKELIQNDSKKSIQPSAPQTSSPIPGNKKTGYLNENFQLFHIKDQIQRDFDFHYHDFNKVVFFLSGNVTYLIEGKAYYLKPGDILLVKQYDIHKPVIEASVPYERIILYIKNDYIRSLNDDVCDISTCFHEIENRSYNLIRLNTTLQTRIRDNISQLEHALKSQEFGSSLLSNSLFMQLMVYLNRIVLEKEYIEDRASLKYDSQTEQILNYINQNLSQDLSIEALAERFYISKYHLMRKFKSETGYTLHNYIIQKRLLQANQYIHQGTGIQKAAEQSGFQDYTTFSRAYKTHFGHAPTAK